MDHLQRLNHQINIVPPYNSEDSLADNTDNDSDYIPEDEGQKRFRYDAN